MRLRRFLVIAACTVLGATAACADISQPSEIPAHLAGRDDLALQRSALITRWNSLQDKIGAQNSQCGQIQADSPLVDMCRSNQAAILSEVQSYKDDLKKYEELLAQAENPSPFDNLMLIRTRILRDLEKAKELRGNATLQKSRLQTLVSEGRQDDQVAAGIENAEQTLIKTEQTIKALEMKLGYTDRAIENMDSALKPRKNYNAEFDSGFGMVLQGANNANVQLLRSGHDSTIPLGNDRFLPGDEIITDASGHTKVSSLGSSNYVIAVGTDTRLKLEEDHKSRGTVWSLNQGVVHYSCLTAGMSAPPARLRTRDSIVQGTPDSEYDVRINEKGETSVEVYRGRVEVQEPLKGVSYFVEAKPDNAGRPAWWNRDE